MENKSEINPTPKAAEQIYRDALTKEGLQAPDDLVRSLQDLHRGTLTAGLVLRAFNAWRRSRRGARSEAE